MIRKGVPPWGVDPRKYERPLAKFAIYNELFKKGTFLAECQGPCQCLCKVSWRPAKTAYCWDGTGEDPNHPLLLCDECAAEYDEYWDSMWDDYYSGLV